jgi:hypothetical protein
VLFSGNLIVKDEFELTCKEIILLFTKALTKDIFEEKAETAINISQGNQPLGQDSNIDPTGVFTTHNLDIRSVVRV